jgi:hypothetical protein
MKTKAKPLFYSIQKCTFLTKGRTRPLEGWHASVARLESGAERVIMRGFLNLGMRVRTYRGRVKRTKLRIFAGER